MSCADKSYREKCSEVRGREGRNRSAALDGELTRGPADDRPAEVKK